MVSEGVRRTYVVIISVLYHERSISMRRISMVQPERSAPQRKALRSASRLVLGSYGYIDSQICQKPGIYRHTCESSVRFRRPKSQNIMKLVVSGTSRNVGVVHFSPRLRGIRGKTNIFDGDLVDFRM